MKNGPDLNSIENSINHEIVVAQEKISKELADLQKQHADEVAKIHQRFAYSRKTRNDALNMVLSDIRNDGRKQIKEVEKNVQKRLALTVNEHLKELERLSQSINDELKPHNEIVQQAIIDGHGKMGIIVADLNLKKAKLISEARKEWEAENTKKLPETTTESQNPKEEK